MSLLINKKDIGGEKMDIIWWQVLLWIDVNKVDTKREDT